MEGMLNPAFLRRKDSSDPDGFISVSIISLHAGSQVLKGVTDRPPVRASCSGVKTYLGVFGCLLEAVVLSGSIFGWASMVYVLEVGFVS